MEGVFSNPDWTVVVDREAADTLIEPKKRRYLEPFLWRPRTQREAADALGVAPSTMHYQVRRLLRLKLLAVVRTERRRGRHCKVYGLASRHFFVPFDMTPLVRIEDLFEQVLEPHFRLFVRHHARAALRHDARPGLRLGVHDDGTPYLALRPTRYEDDAPAPREAHPANLLSLFPVALDRTAAGELVAELERLRDATIAREDENGQGYFVKLGVTPLEER